MEPRDGNFLTVGGAAGLVGFLVYVSQPFEDMLPVNRVLFALLCALVVMLIMVTVDQQKRNK